MKYAPKVRVTIAEGADDSGYIPIDSTVRLRCETDANPNEITYQWFVNDEMVPDANDSELVSVTWPLNQKNGVGWIEHLKSHELGKLAGVWMLQ